jgi:secreted trypsin-like serine protease
MQYFCSFLIHYVSLCYLIYLFECSNLLITKIVPYHSYPITIGDNKIISTLANTFTHHIMHLLLTIFLCFGATLADEGEIQEPWLHYSTAALSGQFPWHVNIVSNSMRSCGGAIISEEWVLTVAHCVQEAKELLIFHGSNDRNSVDTGVSYSNHLIIHEDFDNETRRNDIALIKLDSPLTFDDSVNSIDVAEKELPPGKEITIVGWGLTNDENLVDKEDTLYAATVRSINDTRCQQFYGVEVVHPEMVCVNGGVPVESPYESDDGGPINLTGSRVLVAIYSFCNSLACRNDFPMAFIRTQYYRQWIRDKSGV